MNKIKTIIVLLLVTCLGTPLLSQNTSTQGKEFWLSFMHNGFKDHSFGGWVTTQVLISAKRDCTGTVTNPLTGWGQEFTVRANNITTIDIPEAQGYHDRNNYETISNRGIRVLANDTISVFCTNIAYVSFDASFVLPIESLGDEYIIQSYDQSRISGDDTTEHESSAFLIIATEDNTTIEITPTVNTLGGHQAGQTFTITMNAGESYQVRSLHSGNERDLSGTHILASDCKKIAVFNGNNLTTVPYTTNNGFDQVFEQAMPLRSWGKSFVVTTSLNRNRDFIKITSSANDNQITKNGEPLTTLNAGQSYTFFIRESEHSCFLQATQPSAVYLYHTSSRDENPLGGDGDPSMVWIAPVEQRINDVTFTTFNNSDINITNHSVNIIVNSQDIDKVYFDGDLISPLLFSRVTGNSDYSFIRKDISHGVHRISCVNGFNAHVYGFGYAKGYAYLVGSNAINLSSNLTLNNEVVYSNENYSYCIDKPITFNVTVNIPEYELLWDFDDGTTSNQNQVVHTFSERRVYNVSLVITSNEGGCTGSSNNITHFTVDTRPQYIMESDEICAGELYSDYGFSNVLINNDTILARLEDNPIHPECKDSLLVYITARPNYHVPITDSRCWQEGGGIYDAYGFSFEYHESGTYERTRELQTIDGCDSIVTCHLDVSGNVDGSTETVSECDRYEWYGTSYTESGSYSHVLPTAMGCDSTIHLELSLDYTPNPTPIYPIDTSNHAPHWVITATEFQINNYDFHLWDDNPLSRWDTVVWDFDREVNWLLEPYGDKGKKCKVYVLDQVEDTVWLQAHIRNNCVQGESVTQRYWLISSFYDIDDHYGQPEIEILPNPNRGQMSICFGDMEGRIATTVYDMQGKAIDHFELMVTPKSRHSYTIKGSPNGIYLFVFNQNGHIFTRKAIITN